MACAAQCPRCQQPLSVPNKLAGSYANCPRCQGRFWISKDAPTDPSVNDSAGMPSVSTLNVDAGAAGDTSLARAARQADNGGATGGIESDCLARGGCHGACGGQGGCFSTSAAAVLSLGDSHGAVVVGPLASGATEDGGARR